MSLVNGNYLDFPFHNNYPLLMVIQGHNKRTYIQENGKRINENSLSCTNDHVTDENYSHINDAGSQPPDQGETRVKLVSKDTRTSFNRLFVWSSYDQGEWA